MLDFQQGLNRPEQQDQHDLVAILWGKTRGCIDSIIGSGWRWTQKTLESRLCSMPISRDGDIDRDRGRNEKQTGKEKVSWCKKKR